MAEAVAAAAADDGDLRTEGCEERHGPRGGAAVVRHLQHTEPGRWNHRAESCFDGPPDVSGQHNGHVAVPDLQHQRVVVAHALAFPVGRWWVPRAHSNV